MIFFSYSLGEGLIPIFLTHSFPPFFMLNYFMESLFFYTRGLVPGSKAKPGGYEVGNTAAPADPAGSILLRVLAGKEPSLKDLFQKSPHVRPIEIKRDIFGFPIIQYYLFTKFIYLFNKMSLNILFINWLRKGTYLYF